MNPPHAHSILTGAPGELIFEFAQRMMLIDHLFLKQSFAKYADENAPIQGDSQDIISTAGGQTSWLCQTAIADSLRRADVSFRALKRIPGMMIPIGLPLTRMDEKLESMISGWARHCRLDESTKGGDVPAVAIIDQMSQIGYNQSWADAFAMGAGTVKMEIVAVSQDLAQVNTQFGEEFNSVLQNCAVKIFFGIRDHLTRRHASDLANVIELITGSCLVNPDRQTRAPVIGHNSSKQKRPLINPG